MQRSLALDALRGLAILLMVLSGVIPYGVLPAWMYHAQNPPPTHQTNLTLAGITWVDLVFPFFLFTLGAAFPFALHKRIQSAHSMYRVVLSIIERGIVLTFFAIFLQHIRPHILSTHPNPTTWAVALVGFFILFAIFTRLPRDWPSILQNGIHIMGWGAAVVILLFVKYPDGSGFSLYRSDIILIVLANMALWGATIWLITRNHTLLRLGFLGILIALRLAAKEAGWVQYLWQHSPLPWVFKMPYLQYLFIVIPATIVGDVLYQFMQKNPKDLLVENQSPAKWLFLAGISTLPIFITLVGLQNRWVVHSMMMILIFCIFFYKFISSLKGAFRDLLLTLSQWGIFWLILGFFFEPYEGGIKKSPATLSYYFISLGLAIFLLISFAIIIEGLKRKGLNLLVETGQNPMIAYVGVANFIWPVLGLTGLDQIINQLTSTPWLGFCRGLLTTLVLAIIVRQFTRWKIFWRT